MIQVKHPLTGKVFEADLVFIKSEYKRVIGQLIALIIKESDYTKCIPCGDSSPEFRKKSGLVTHLRMYPEHLVDYFIEKSRLYKVEARCCENELRYNALIRNKPLGNYVIQLCSIHVNDEMYTKNATRIVKIREKN